MKKIVQQYVNMAKQAGKENAHVAVAMYYRTAAELTSSNEELTGILNAVVDYADRLKKPIDQLAVYHWEQQVVSAKLKENPLEKKVEQLIEKTRLEMNENATS